MDSFQQAHNDHLDPDLNEEDPTDLTPDGADPEMAKFLNETLYRDNLSGWKETAYKGTSCGAWLTLKDPKTIKMGSIVEGVDQCVTPIALTFPFTSKEVWDALTEIEQEADRIWNETHGCEVCYPDSDPDEFTAVNPDCKNCNGEGICI